MKKVLEFSLSDFFKNAIKPMLITGMFILFSCKVIDYISPQNFLDFVFQYAEYTIIILFIIILFGLNNQERSVIIKFIKSKIRC